MKYISNTNTLILHFKTGFFQSTHMKDFVALADLFFFQTIINLNSILNTFRLILAKGADPNALDTNGNNVCHMMVILNKKDMFDMAYETGADARIFNNQVYQFFNQLF